MLEQKHPVDWVDASKGEELLQSLGRFCRDRPIAILFSLFSRVINFLSRLFFLLFVDRLL